LAIADSSDASLSVLLGNGNGTFQGAVSVPVSNTSEGIVAGDFNRDGKMDLVATVFGGSGLQLLLGNGNGTFAAAVNLPSNAFFPQSLTSGDVNADGIVDVVATDYYQAYVVAL